MANDGAGPVGRWKETYTLLSLCIGAYFAVRFSQVVIGPVVPLLLDEFEASRGAIGTVLTGMWIVYALLQLPSAVFADRSGERRIVLVALGITACATVGMALAPTFLVFALAVVGVGVGAGAYYNPATALLARELTEIGGAIGTHRVGGQVAGVLAPVVAAAVSLRYGWRVAIVPGALLSAVAAGSFLWQRAPSPPVRPGASPRELFDPGTLLDLLVRPHTRDTTFLMALVEFVDLATMAFLATFLVEYHDYSLQRANLLFGTFFAVSALGQPLGGWLSDRIGRDGTVAIQLAAGVLGFGALLAGTGPIVVPAVVLSGAAMSSTPVLQSRMMDGLTTANRGKGFGVFRTLYLLIGATGTAIVGTAADVAGWGVAFGLIVALLCVVLLSLVAMRLVGGTDRPSTP